MSWSRRGFGRAVGLGVAALGGVRPGHANAAASARASASARKATIIARAMSYERSLSARVGQSLRLAILYAGGQMNSLRDAESWRSAFGALDGIKIYDMPLVVTTYPWGGEAASVLHKLGTDVLVVCEGLEGQLSAITAFSRKDRLLSVGTQRRHLDTACTLGVFEDSGKPEIVINLSAAEREDVKFSSRLLKLAKVIR